MSANIYWRSGIAWARFKVRGTEYRQSLSTRSEREAVRRLKALRTAVEDEAMFGIKPPMSWEASVVSWNSHALAALSSATVTRYIVSLRQLAPHLDGRMLHQIDAELLRDIAKARRAAGATTATLKNDLTAMSSVLAHAMEEGWIDTNPTLSFRTLRSMQVRHVPIVLPDEAAIAAMLAASPSRFADAQIFARETGLREEEIFGMRHTQIDLKAGTVTVVGKRNRLRVLPLSVHAAAAIAGQPQHIKQPWVWWHGNGQRWTSPGSRFGDIRRRVAQKAAQEERPFDPYRFHDLRHLHAVEYLRDRRGTIYDLQRRLGHSSIKTTERYLEFLTPEEALFAQHGLSQPGAQTGAQQ